MAEKNSKFVAFVAVLLFTAIGFVLMFFLRDLINGMNATGIVKDFVDAIKTQGLLEGLLALVLCIVVYFGVGKAVSSGEKIGPLSLWFLFLWIGAVLGIFVGIIIWDLIQGGSVSFNLNTVVDTVYFWLAASLGPAFAAALSLSNK